MEKENKTKPLDEKVINGNEAGDQDVIVTYFRIPRFCKTTKNSKYWDKWFVLESDYLKVLEQNKSAFKNFLEEMDWDKEEYDYVKLMLETKYGADVDRTLWEHCFKLTCLALKKKKEKSALKHLGEGLIPK